MLDSELELELDNVKETHLFQIRIRIRLWNYNSPSSGLLDSERNTLILNPDPNLVVEFRNLSVI